MRHSSQPQPQSQSQTQLQTQWVPGDAFPSQHNQLQYPYHASISSHTRSRAGTMIDAAAASSSSSFSSSLSSYALPLPMPAHAAVALSIHNRGSDTAEAPTALPFTSRLPEFESKSSAAAAGGRHAHGLAQQALQPGALRSQQATATTNATVGAAAGAVAGANSSKGGFASSATSTILRFVGLGGGGDGSINRPSRAPSTSSSSSLSSQGAAGFDSSHKSTALVTDTSNAHGHPYALTHIRTPGTVANSSSHHAVAVAKGSHAFTAPPATARDTRVLLSLYSKELERQGWLERPGQILRSRWHRQYCVVSQSGFLHLFDSPTDAVPINTLSVCIHPHHHSYYSLPYCDVGLRLSFSSSSLTLLLVALHFSFPLLLPALYILLFYLPVLTISHCCSPFFPLFLAATHVPSSSGSVGACVRIRGAPAQHKFLRVH